MKQKMFPDEVCQGLNTINMEALRQLPWRRCGSCCGPGLRRGARFGTVGVLEQGVLAIACAAS